MTETVTRHDRGPVTWLVVDRQTKLNVLNSDMIAQLIRQLTAVKARKGLRAVVLSGAGERAFVGGADIAEMAALDAEGARDFISRLHDAMAALRGLSVPVVGRVDGYCLGGGMELAAACDFRFATERSRFGMPEVRVGLPSVIEAALLPGLIGWGRCRWLLMTGEMIDAATARDWGFVDFLTAPAEIDDAIRATLDAIIAAGPTAVATQKQMMRAWEGQTPDQASAESIPIFAQAYETGEPQAMLGAFLAARQKGGQT